MTKILSKSSYMKGLQCPRYLFYYIHKKHEIPAPDDFSKLLMQAGTDFGKLATKLFKGKHIPEEDFNKSLNLTKRYLNKKTIFEAAIQVDQLYSRADILQLTKEGYNIIEVKATTRVKDEHIQDLSFQLHVYEKANIKINKCYLAHVNNQYKKQGKLDLKQLIKLVDVTKQVKEESKGIKERIEAMLEIINNNEQPSTTLSKTCTNCPLPACKDFLPEHNVTHLYRIGSKAYELIEDGIHHIHKIPKEYKLTKNQEIQRTVSKNNKPYIHKESIKHFLKTITYPIYYLDFESYSAPIPPHNNTNPYQNIPFQYSLHIQNTPGEQPTHKEYLHNKKTDPRKQLLKQLKKDLGTTGSIIAYNQSFEKSVITKLGELSPKDKLWTQKTNDRMIDLLIPFRNFYYYHPSQKGSASIKYVLPAITGKGYSGLNINNGGLASYSFLRMTRDKISDKEREIIYKDLLEYCKLDTIGMVWIVDELRKLST